MKSSTLTILGIFAMLIGAALCICYRSITSNGVTVAAGIFFLAIGVINLLFPGKRPDGSPQQGAGRFMSLMADVSAFVLGVSMLVFSSTFAKIISFIFGIVVAFAALWQFVFLISYGKSQWRMPAWLYIFPVLMTAGAVFIFLQDIKTDYRTMMGTGLSLITLGVASIIENIWLGMVNRRIARQNAAHASVGTDSQTGTDTPHDAAAGIDASHQATLKAATSQPETTDDLDDEILPKKA